MMKKLVFCLLALVGTGAMISCQQDDFVSESSVAKGATIRASLPGDASSRVILGETDGETTDLYWQENDVITVTIGDTPYVFTISDYAENQTEAIFTCADAPALVAGETYTFVYGVEPEKIQAGTKEGLSAYHQMKAIYEAKAGDSWENVGLVFDTQIAIVEITLKENDENVISATKVSLYDAATGACLAKTEEGSFTDKVYFAVASGVECKGLVLVETASGSYVEELGQNMLEPNKLYRINKGITKALETSDFFPLKYAIIGDEINGHSVVLYGEGEMSGVFDHYLPSSYMDKIKHVIVLEGVTNIAASSFSDLSNLATVVIPASVVDIEKAPFFECTNLSEVTIGAGSKLSYIGASAFYNCTSLTSIIIPASVECIDADAFDGCTNLTSVTFEEGSLLERISYKAFFACKGLTTITIPASVISIDRWAFSYCTNLTTVTFEEGSQLTSIGGQAFSSCNVLLDIVLPSGVTSIGESAFSVCKSLEDITIPSGVLSIGKNTFSSCSNLNAITFEEGIQLESIGEYAFSQCKRLEAITIPSGVQSIGQYAFSDCTNLTSVTFEDGIQLENIEEWTFYNCENLASITIPANVVKIDRNAFYACAKLNSVTIPDESQLTTIGSCAFLMCYELTSITLPASITTIENSAFGERINFESVTCWAAEPPALGGDAFGAGNVVVYVPEASVDAYKAATDWSDYAANIQAIPTTMP